MNVYDFAIATLERALGESFKIIEVALVVGLLSYAAFSSDIVALDALALAAKYGFLIWFFCRAHRFARQIERLTEKAPTMAKAALHLGILGATLAGWRGLNTVILAGMIAAF